MPDKKTSPGDRFRDTPFHTSAFQNDTIDVVDAWRSGRLDLPRTPTSVRGDSNLVRIKNETGSNLALGDVVYLGDYKLNANNRSKPWFEGNAVGTTFSARFAIAARPIPANKYGPAYTGGVALAHYDTGTPAAGDTLGPKPSQATVALGCPGCEVIDLFDASAKLAWVFVGSPITEAIVKTTGAVTGGTSATTAYDIYDTDGGIFSGADAGFTTVPDAYSKVDIDSGLFARLRLFGKLGLLEQLECNA